MKFKHWFYIILIQIVLVVIGLLLYHRFLGGTGIDPGDAITIWATVLTIVFIIFSVLGIMNIDGKISELKESLKEYKTIKGESTQLISTIESSKKELIEKAQNEINKIIKNSSEIQNYYLVYSSIEAIPAPDKRIALYTDLITKTPTIEGFDKAYPYIKRGEAYMQIGLLNKAKADFDFALDNCTDINKSTVYACLGGYYISIRNFEKSIECFKNALANNPDSASICMDLGNSLNAMERFDEAQEYYDRALAINPESAEIYYNKAKRLLDTTKDRTSAEIDQIIAYLDKSISQNPHFFKSYINKASLLREQGKEKEAIEVLNQIVVPVFNPEFLMGIEQRGIANRITQNHAKALNDFNFVLFYDPHNIQNLSNIAATCFAMRKYLEAEYYAKLGLEEATAQDKHYCDGDFHSVLQAIQNIHNQMHF